MSCTFTCITDQRPPGSTSLYPDSTIDALTHPNHDVACNNYDIAVPWNNLHNHFPGCRISGAYAPIRISANCDCHHPLRSGPTTITHRHALEVDSSGPYNTFCSMLLRDIWIPVLDVLSCLWILLVAIPDPTLFPYLCIVTLYIR